MHPQPCKYLRAQKNLFESIDFFFLRVSNWHDNYAHFKTSYQLLKNYQNNHKLMGNLKTLVSTVKDSRAPQLHLKKKKKKKARSPFQVFWLQLNPVDLSSRVSYLWRTCTSSRCANYCSASSSLFLSSQPTRQLLCHRLYLTSEYTFTSLQEFLGVW